jgi:hypothetical protein
MCVTNVFIVQWKYNNSVYKHLKNLKSYSSRFRNPIYMTTGIARNIFKQKNADTVIATFHHYRVPKLLERSPICKEALIDKKRNGESYSLKTIPQHHQLFH